MSTLLIAAALIAAIAGICLLLISINNKQKRNAMNNFLNRLSQAGSSNNLSFSSQEILNDIAIGLDGQRRELLVLSRFKNGDYFDLTIDINNVQSCTIRKKYGFIKAGDLKNGRLEKHLEEIVLHLELYHSGSTDIPFFNFIDNRPDEAAALENKARRWELILTKLMSERFSKDKVTTPAIYYPSHHSNFNKKKKVLAVDKEE